MEDVFSALTEGAEPDTIGTATYSPEDNKIRIYPATRLSAEDYAAVKAAGFSWAPRQELFVAPAWSPRREDFARRMCGEIGDEDTSLVDRAEAKAERLENLSGRKMQQAESAQKAVHAIADGIPFGQPILVGHHSERHARKDAEKIENGMRKAIECWKAAQYWQDRAKGAIRLAKYKERPDVRARRIKGLEADKRKEERSQADAEKFLKAYEDPQARTAKLRDGRDLLPALLQTWEGGLSYGNQTRLKNEELPFEEALSMATSAKRATVANTQRWIDHLSNRIAYERAMLDEQGGLVAEQHEIKVGGRVLVDGEWVVVLRVNRKDGKACSFRTARRYVPVVGAEEVRGYEPPSGEEAAKVEAAMKKGPLCNYPGERFATCTQAEWDAIYKDHRGVEVIAATDTTGTHRVRKAIGLKLHLPAPTGEELEPGYCNANRTRHYWPVFITDAKRKDPPTKEPETPASVDDLTPAMFNHSTHSKSCGNAPEPTRSSPDLFAPKMDFEEIAARTERLKASNAAREEREAAAAPFKALEEQLKCGVKVIAAPQLFPTPSELAARMVEEANIEPSQDVLEPSAGTGAICKAILASEPTAKVFAVEINGRLCELLSQTITPREDADQRICRNVLQGDFLEQNGNLGQFDRILMNPPFENGADIKHIQHAMHMLKPGGRLVAICANGPRQQAALKPLAENSGGWYEDLPAGTFASQGTNVSTALLLIEN